MAHPADAGHRSRRHPSESSWCPTDEVGGVRTGEEALAAMEDAPADIAILDLNLPGMDGLQCFEKLKERWPDIAAANALGFDCDSGLYQSDHELETIGTGVFAPGEGSGAEWGCHGRAVSLLRGAARARVVRSCSRRKSKPFTVPTSF